MTIPNSQLASLTLALSAAPPYGHISGTTVYYGPASGLFTVTATAGDPLAGLDTLAFPDTTSSGAEHPLNGAATATRSRVYTFDQSSIFSATASVTAADRAGNVQTVPFTVTRDITPPEVAIHVPASSGLVIPVTWSGQDTLSGLRHYTIRYSPSLTGPWTTWLTATTATSGQFPGAAGQTYYFQVEAVDNVNNTATAQAGPVTISPVTKYYYHGGTRVAMRQGDVVHFLHTDHLGSTSLTTDATGAPIAQSRYLPYGEQRWTNGDPPTDFTFTGQRRDSFGLLDYNARYYNSGLGRFISPDTIVPNPANPQSLNRYAYGYNNPVKFSDSTGHCPLCVAVAGVIIALDAVDVGSSLYITSYPSQFNADDISYAETSLALWQAGMMADGPMLAGDAIAAVQGAWRGSRSLWRWGTRALTNNGDTIFRSLDNAISGSASKFDPTKLDAIIGSLEQQGFTIIRGEAATRHLESVGAGAAYTWDSGAPGVLWLKDSASVSEVVEELFHVGQHRSRGWQTVDYGTAEYYQLEIDAQRYLLDHKEHLGLSQDEIDATQNALSYYQDLLEQPH